MSRRGVIAGAAGLVAFAVGPASAAAATCPLPAQAEPGFAEAIDVEGDIDPSRTGGYLQIPFDVPDGTTAIRVRYSYDQPGDTCVAPPGPSNTLDMGVYAPRDAGDPVWGIDESRGWSGSAVRDLAIAVNGFSDEATYESAPKALVHGRTTRAYRPGEIPAGEWAVELGLAFIVSPDPNGIHYRVLVETTSSADWSDDPYAPSGYSTAPVRADAGWYAGDMHVHGEQEPGNATMTATFARAFGSLSSGGSGLDFVTIVDHNNDVAHDDLAGHQATHPDNLIIPGTEVTTYRGHHNDQGSGPLVDFRGGPVLAPAAGTDLGANVPDGALERVREPLPPSGQFAELASGGNWSQINHPTIFRDAPSACRGCAWSYDDAETDYSKVDAIEVQTGPAGIPWSAPAAPNPFTRDGLRLLRARARDRRAHRRGRLQRRPPRRLRPAAPSTRPVGSATTMVYADELSQAGSRDGVKGDHTYVKLFGNDGPDVDFTAEAPGEAHGDDRRLDAARLAATLRATVDRRRRHRPARQPLARAAQGRRHRRRRSRSPATPSRHEFAAEWRGPLLDRGRPQLLGQDFVEVYTSPIWVGSSASAKPSNQLPDHQGEAQRAPGDGEADREGAGAG